MPDLYARHTKIWISQGVDWISTASGSERSLRQRSLATARGTDSSSQSRSWCAQHIDLTLLNFSSLSAASRCISTMARSTLARLASHRPQIWVGGRGQFEPRSINVVEGWLQAEPREDFEHGRAPVEGIDHAARGGVGRGGWERHGVGRAPVLPLTGADEVALGRAGPLKNRVEKLI